MATCPVLPTSTATGDAPAAAVSDPADRIVSTQHSSDSERPPAPRPEPIGRDLIGYAFDSTTGKLVTVAEGRQA